MPSGLAGLAAFVGLAVFLYLFREGATALFALFPEAGGAVGQALDVAWGVLTWVLLPFAAGLLALRLAFAALGPDDVGRALGWYVRLVSVGALAYAGLSVTVMGKSLFPDIVDVAVQALFAGLAAAVLAATTGARVSPED